MSAMVNIKWHYPGEQNAVLTLELERNGEAWGEDLPFGNPHFRFGKLKAQVVLASWDIIEEYVATIGAKPALFEVQERFVPNTKWSSRANSPTVRGFWSRSTICSLTTETRSGVSALARLRRSCLTGRKSSSCLNRNSQEGEGPEGGCAVYSLAGFGDLGPG